MSSSPSHGPDPSPRGTRRSFLETLVAGAAGATLAGVAGGSSAAGVEGEVGLPGSPLPRIALGPHQISRLILGGNPVYGYSHFNRLYDQHLRDYHTPGRVVELLRATTQAGINAWQNSYAPRTLEDVERCRAAGIDFRWLLLGKPDWAEHPEAILDAARHKPIGIAPHGHLAERLDRGGKLDQLRDLLKRIRDVGSLVGLSSHNPALIDRAESEGWDVDYYMCCLYYLTRPREEFAKLLGETPVGEVYLQSDRVKMLERVRSVRKPCLVYKVLAAGRLDLSPDGVQRTLQETLAAIKPSDGMIVGMFQELGDQVGANARAVRSAGR